LPQAGRYGQFQEFFGVEQSEATEFLKLSVALAGVGGEWVGTDVMGTPLIQAL